MSSLTETLVETVEKTPAVVAAQEDKRLSAERVLSELLRLMGTPAKLDFKDADDGSLSVALMFEAQLPGVVPGKRSQWLDSLQFLVNKIVNKPGLERRWVNLGAYGHPPPRPPRREPLSDESLPAAPPVAASSAAKPSRNGQVKNGRKLVAAPPSAPVAQAVNEASLEVASDPVLAAAAKALVEKSAKFGRFYAVFYMDAENRSRVVQSAASVKGSSVKAEGEGRMRRVVFTPEQPKPMPKFVLPDWDEDEDDDASAEE